MENGLKENSTKISSMVREDSTQRMEMWWKVLGRTIFLLEKKNDSFYIFFMIFKCDER
jgi:hypothetical protein